MTELINNTNSTAPTPRKSTINIIAGVISLIFTPLLAPTYGVLLSLNYTFIVGLSQGSTRAIIILTTFAITCMLPACIIALLHRLGKISDPGVNEQKERFIPYIAAIICYVVCAIYLRNINAPTWIPMFIIGGGIAAIASALINLKWKISAHGAGMGGIIALTFTIWCNGYNFIDFMPLASIAIIAAGLVGSSRIILNRHTLGHVLAGILNGFFWVFIMTI